MINLETRTGTLFRHRSSGKLARLSGVDYDVETVELECDAGTEQVSLEVFEDWFTPAMPAAPLGTASLTGDVTSGLDAAEAQQPSEFGKAKLAMLKDADITKRGVTGSDMLGYVHRVGGTDADGCRLGCACAQHEPPREPYIPNVDEWDLLPDVKP